MDIKELLVRAEKDRAIRAALLMLSDIIDMASEVGDICHIDAEEFARRYNYTKRTFFRHRKTLIEHGYIRRVGRFQVELLALNSDKNRDTTVANCDTTVVLYEDKNRDTTVANCDTTVAMEAKREKEKKESNKERKEREKKEVSIGALKPTQNASSAFVDLPQSLNPFGNLKLTQSQLEALTAKHSETVLQHELPRVSAWLANQEPNKWRNHFAGLTNWLSNEFGKKAKANINPYATSAGNW